MRLDLFLVAKKLVRSRNQAQRLISEGKVRVNGVVATKTSEDVAGSERIQVDDVGFVARSAAKLQFALDSFKIEVPFICLDVGASTGGFTQVLLESGANKVIALDVGTSQLAVELREDSRVVDFSPVNIREVSREELPFQDQIGLVVVDLSFISLKLVSAKLVELAPRAEFVILIKPQFELSREELDKHGVVKQEGDRLSALQKVLTDLGQRGLRVMGLVESPITGLSGNIEYLAHLQFGEPLSDEQVIQQISSL